MQISAEATLSPLMRLHATDNVMIARGPVQAGTPLLDGQITAATLIPRGHKVATMTIAAGEPILRYGQVIGFASQAIAPGELVHVHNCEMREFDRDTSPGVDARPTAFANEPATFAAIVRENGQVATRNYVGILTSVNCSAGTARYIAEAFRKNPFTGEGLLADFPNVDGVIALGHRTGCGMASEGAPVDVLRRVIAGYARHPNFAAVLMVGLGCEANQLGALLRAEGLVESDKLATLVIQESGGARKSVERGVAHIRAMLPQINQVRREPVSAQSIDALLRRLEEGAGHRTARL